MRAAVVPATFDTRDRIYAGLRVLSLVAGLGYVFVSLAPGPARSATLTVFYGFVVYSLLLYTVGWKLISRLPKGAFYALTSALDLMFLVVLMHRTGDAASPFYRALYLWVAMLAFYFGFRGGRIASGIALAVFLVFHGAELFQGDLWLFSVQAGGILMHGPLIGYLVDRERQRAWALELARDEIVRANSRIIEEQAKLIQAEKLSSIGLLAAGVAHEINNPLSGIKGCLKALQQGSVSPERKEEYFQTIREGLERIGATVEGLLDYARERSPMRVEVDLDEAISACLRLLAPAVRRKQLHIDVRISPGHGRIVADRSQIMQAIVNVLMNAAHASPLGGTIVVSAFSRDGTIGIRIADRGPGIPREHLARVCDPFFTTKPEGEGTGLGLAVTLGIVRAHGGDLTIESEAGQGTDVTLWLPRSIQEGASHGVEHSVG